ALKSAGTPSSLPSSGDNRKYIAATDPQWPVESVRGSDPRVTGNGGFKDSENFLGIGGWPVMLPWVASSVAVTSFATRRPPPEACSSTTPFKPSVPFNDAAVFGVKAKW